LNALGLVAALRERGLIATDLPPPPEETDRPWFVALLMGIAGWIAGLFIIVFLALVLDVSSGRQMLVIGLVLLGMAWALYAASRDFVFIDQLALALSIAGQLALAYYFAERLHDFRSVIAALFGLQLLLFAAMPDGTARTFAMFCACIGWVFVVRFWLRPYEGGGGFLDAQGHIAAPSFGVWSLPIEWIVTWAPPIALVTWLRRIEPAWLARHLAAFARPALTGLLLGIALGGICAEPESQLLLGGGVGRGFGGWALFPLLSIGLALFAAYGAFALRSAGLSGVCIVAALAHLSRFYYLYGTTLTIKSAIMLCAGLLFLAAAWLLVRRAGANA
jgi:uncharacterized protein DUF4401